MIMIRPNTTAPTYADSPKPPLPTDTETVRAYMSKRQRRGLPEDDDKAAERVFRLKEPVPLKFA